LWLVSSLALSTTLRYFAILLRGNTQVGTGNPNFAARHIVGAGIGILFNLVNLAAGRLATSVQRS